MPSARTLSSRWPSPWSPPWLALALLACSGTADDKATDDTTAQDDSGQTDDSGSTDDSADPPAEAWSWCPSEAPSGDTSWSEALTITDDALYCGTSSEGRTLREEIGAKAQLRLMPGVLPVPGEPLEGGVASVPACVMLDEGQPGLVSSGEAELTVAWNEYGGQVYYQLSVSQPLESPDGEPWELYLQLSGLAEGGLQTIDGAHLPTFGDHGLDAWICQAGDCSIANTYFLSCGFDDVDTDRHSLTFEGGELQLDLRIGESFASTEPSAFVEARGELDGEAFTQSDYWRLIYNPTHHHFTRDFIAFFDDPIGEACGLSAVELDPWGDDPPPSLHLVDCDGRPLEERAITGETYELLP